MNQSRYHTRSEQPEQIRNAPNQTLLRLLRLVAARVARKLKRTQADKCREARSER